MLTRPWLGGPRGRPLLELRRSQVPIVESNGMVASGHNLPTTTRSPQHAADSSLERECRKIVVAPIEALDRADHLLSSPLDLYRSVTSEAVDLVEATDDRRLALIETR